MMLFFTQENDSERWARVGCCSGLTVAEFEEFFSRVVAPKQGLFLAILVPCGGILA